MSTVHVGAVCRALGMDGTTWGRKETRRTARSPTSSCRGEVARAVKNTRQERQSVCQGDRVFLGESGPLCQLLLRQSKDTDVSIGFSGTKVAGDLDKSTFKCTRRRGSSCAESD